MQKNPPFFSTLKLGLDSIEMNYDEIWPNTPSDFLKLLNFESTDIRYLEFDHLRASGGTLNLGVTFAFSGEYVES